mgnify:CR=1 FL=1
MPMTAHFLGGAPIGTSAGTGVIDPYHRVFNYPGLSVVDGAAVSANLGVNPSLTITAQAERAFRSGRTGATPIRGRRSASRIAGWRRSRRGRRPFRHMRRRLSACPSPM